MEKNNRIAFRVTKKEKVKLLKTAKNKGISLSEYILEQVLYNDIRVINELAEILPELKGIGKQINELTYLSNSKTINEINLKDINFKLNKVNNILFDIWIKYF